MHCFVVFVACYSVCLRGGCSDVVEKKLNSVSDGDRTEPSATLSLKGRIFSGMPLKLT